MTEQDFVRAVQLNAVNRLVLQRLPSLGLPDAWLVSGALFQTIWNLRSGNEPGFGIKDYDVFYFDPDTSWEAEDAAIARARDVFPNLPVEVRNQARVHLWYEAKFGLPYAPLRRATDGIDRFLMPCAQVGLRVRGAGFELYAPSGLDDVDRMIVRPNRCANFSADRYAEKADAWKGRWPALTVEAPRDDAR
jgi:hypothetical protein